MSIVSSTFTLDNHQQQDGRIYVTERHTDSTGIVHSFEYLASPAADHQMIMENRAVLLAASLADSEAETVMQQ